jgi:hypothetical protein
MPLLSSALTLLVTIAAASMEDMAATAEVAIDS